MVSSKAVVAFLAFAIILGAEAMSTPEYRSRGGPGSHEGHKGHGG